MALSLFVVRGGVRYPAECRTLSRDEVASVLQAWREDLEELKDQCSDRIKLACGDTWHWETYARRKTEPVFALTAPGALPGTIGLLAADEDGRMEKGGLCVNIYCVSKSPRAYVERISNIGTCMIAKTVAWSSEVDLEGRAAIPVALGPSTSNRLDNPALAYRKMGFHTVKPALDGVSSYVMEISGQASDDLIKRFDDGQ